MTDRLRAYYAGFDEWARLESPAGRLEYERTLRVLSRHLDEPVRILDLGGGPGRYAITLAWLGHRVVLGDLSPDQLEVARAKIAEAELESRVEAVLELDARDMSAMDDDGFEVVLAFGPFYHILDEVERQRAAREIARILKPGGLVFVSFIPHLSGLAALIDRARFDPDQISLDAPQRAWTEGSFINASERGMPLGSFLRPVDVEALFAEVGLGTVELLSLRGLAAGREAALLELRETQPALYEAFEEVLDASCMLPEVVATSDHALWIGQAPL